MMTMLVFLGVAVISLAYANGANDNFKGVATLSGSGSTDYRKALVLATATTFLGSLTALYIGEGLAATFSGKGLVPDSAISDPAFLFAVGAGAAGTVLIATRFGLPVSTTHAIMGALVGAGLVSTGGDIRWTGLVGKFLLPLLASPFLALIISSGLSTIASRFPLAFGIPRDACMCAGREKLMAVASQASNVQIIEVDGYPSATLGTSVECLNRYGHHGIHFNTRAVVNRLHYFSAGAVSFARGLNDTPKVAALMAAAHIMEVPAALFVVGIAMAMGGLISSRRVADTMSVRITEMDHSSGFTANLVTAFLVIFASGWGMPVSTTHVSCGSLFGIGLINGSVRGSVRGRARWKTISSIFFAWVTTFPLAAILSGLAVLLT